MRDGIKPMHKIDEYAQQHLDGTLERRYGGYVTARPEPPKLDKVVEQQARRITQLEKQINGGRHAPKIGRNDPCPCNSGLKHKKCCMGRPG